MIKVPQIRAIQRIHFVARSPTSLTFGMIYPPCFLIRRITSDAMETRSAEAN
jgi:hypothetical protein